MERQVSVFDAVLHDAATISCDPSLRDPFRCRLVFQGIIAVTLLILPFFLRPGYGIRAYGYPFIAILAWGAWRMAYYDPATSNDIPGMGYVVVAFCYPVIARVLFAVRCAFLRRKRSPLANVPPFI